MQFAFATDETIEQYEYLKIVTRIEDAAHAGLTKLGNAVDKTIMLSMRHLLVLARFCCNII